MSYEDESRDAELGHPSYRRPVTNDEPIYEEEPIATFPAGTAIEDLFGSIVKGFFSGSEGRKKFDIRCTIDAVVEGEDYDDAVKVLYESILVALHLSGQVPTALAKNAMQLPKGAVQRGFAGMDEAPPPSSERL